jgi:hypothetical protein
LQGIIALIYIQIMPGQPTVKFFLKFKGENLEVRLIKCYSTGDICGGVPELADGLDLGSSAAMRGGSSPPFPT